MVVYTSQDQVYAEPILKTFSRSSGIKVRAVYDSEAVKTVGLANRLLAEKAHPQCDLFWNNEELRTRQLAAQSLFRETNGWTHFGFRTRRLIINTNKLAMPRDPFSLTELTNTRWRGKIVLAYPMFGTTATHFLALRQYWGEEQWLRWCRALQANTPFLVDGNSGVVKFVARGDAWIGLTDSDDVTAGQREGLPVAALPLTAETLFIPNTVAVLRNCPNPAAAAKLFRYLQTPEVLDRLLAAGALEGNKPGLRPGLITDWEVVLKDLAPATEAMKGIFLTPAVAGMEKVE